MKKKADFIGMELLNGDLVIVFDQGADAVRFPLLGLKQVHTKFAEEGRVTLMFQSKQLFVSKAIPSELKNLLEALDEAVGGARKRGRAAAPHGYSAALLDRFFPDQMKKHKRALREAASSDAPLPQAGHTQIMAVVDGKGATPAQVGKKLAEVATLLGLTTHTRNEACHAQAYAASCRDAAKVIKLGLCVRTCTHHKIASPLYAEIDVAAGVDCAALRASLQTKLGQQLEMVSMPHGAFKERLAEGLAVHIRHGLRRSNRAFCSRLELRWSEMEAAASPLGICEVEYFEEGGRVPAPTCVLLRLNREPCASWSQAHGERKPSLLATSLVSRLEIFCLRLSATASGTAARPKLLVAGWLPEVDTVPFVKRGFRFSQEPNASLGFKLLKTDADRAKATKTSSDSPAPPPTTAHQGKRKRSATEEGAPATASSSSKFEPWPVRKPASGPAAEEAAAQPSQTHGEPLAGEEEQGRAEAGAEEPGEAQPAYTFGGGDGDAIELGELSDLGRVAPAAAARAAAEALARTGEIDGEVVASRRWTEAMSTEAMPAAVSTEAMDDIDAALAEMI